MRGIDKWIARNMFNPPIIGLCRLFNFLPKQVEFLFRSVACAVVAKLLITGTEGVMRYVAVPFGIFEGILGIVCLLVVVAISIQPAVASRKPDKDRIFVRIWWLGVFIWLVGSSILFGTSTNKTDGMVFAVCFIIAEYASLLKTIPPRETRFTKTVENNA